MNRTYVITGAGSGIGAATAKALKDLGNIVIGVDLKNSDIEADLSIHLLDATKVPRKLSKLQMVLLMLSSHVRV